MTDIPDLSGQIAGLHDLDTGELRSLWCEDHDCEPIARMSRDLLMN